MLSTPEGTKLVARYFQQLTKGCGWLDCRNVLCGVSRATYRDQPNSAAAEAIRLVLAGTLQLCAPPPTTPYLTLRSVSSLVADSKVDGSFTALSTLVYEVCASADALAASFVAPRGTLGWAGDVGVDAAEAHAGWTALAAVADAGVQGALVTGLSALVVHVQRRPLPPHVQRRVAAILLCNSQFADPSTHEVLAGVYQIVTAANADGAIEAWLAATHTVETLGEILDTAQQFLTLRILQSIAPGYVPNADTQVADAVRAIEVFWKANARMPPAARLPIARFTNDAVNQTESPEHDLTLWHDRAPPHVARGRVSFCNFPFILSLPAKTQILELENRALQQHGQRQTAFQLMMSGRRELTHDDLYLTLKIDRANILRDAITQVSLIQPERLRQRLRIRFEGEEGIDEGGVQKEFFQLIIRDLFDPKFGMFTYDAETRLYWFNANTLEVPAEFRLLGTLLGLAIYNSVILDVRLPAVVYRKLFGLPVALDDLAELQPALVHGLRQLLAYAADDVADVFQREFTVESEFFGEVQVHELCPGGRDMPLTNENRELYVTLYVDYLLSKSIRGIFAAFSDGFWEVCRPSPAFALFRADELQVLICGTENLDFVALEAATRYDVYTAQSPVVRWFWEVAATFSDQEKRQLLFFCTGCDRVPVGGMATLRFVLGKQGADSDRLPSSHTCFSVLLLPEYASKDKLDRLLRLAIQNAEGFGML